MLTGSSTKLADGMENHIASTYRKTSIGLTATCLCSLHKSSSFFTVESAGQVCCSTSCTDLVSY